MIKVRFFGILRLDLGIKEMYVEAQNVKELLSQVAEKTGKITAKELKDYLIYINGTLLSGVVGFHKKLKENDEVIIMNPSSGG